MHLRGAPLYQAVAYWVLLEGRHVTVRNVSEAFCLTTRKARDVLHYITHEAGTAVDADIDERRDPSSPSRGGRGVKTVYIRRVYPHLFPQKKQKETQPDRPEKAKTVASGRKARPGTADEHCGIQTLRKWFVSRRPGEPVPEIRLPE